MDSDGADLLEVSTGVVSLDEFPWRVCPSAGPVVGFSSSVNTWEGPLNGVPSRDALQGVPSRGTLGGYPS
jgi:hypothetical protein